jgi:hypothetical protein
MSSELSPRNFAKAAACASLGTLAAGCSRNEPEVAQAQPGQAPASQTHESPRIPQRVLVATAAYQVEGAWVIELMRNRSAESSEVKSLCAANVENTGQLSWLGVRDSTPFRRAEGASDAADTCRPANERTTSSE